jgi:hypothetical protein
MITTRLGKVGSNFHSSPWCLNVQSHSRLVCTGREEHGAWGNATKSIIGTLMQNISVGVAHSPHFVHWLIVRWRAQPPTPPPTCGIQAIPLHELVCSTGAQQPANAPFPVRWLFQLLCVTTYVLWSSFGSFLPVRWMPLPMKTPCTEGFLRVLSLNALRRLHPSVPVRCAASMFSLVATEVSDSVFSGQGIRDRVQYVEGSCYLSLRSPPTDAANNPYCRKYINHNVTW